MTSPPERGSRPSIARWLIRAAVSVIAIAVLLRIIPLRTVLAALARVNGWAWAASAVVFFAGHFANAAKLRVLLGPPAPPLLSCVRAHYAGLAANLGMPGLTGGDLVRGTYLVRTVGLQRVAVASVVDRFVDTFTIAAFIVVALPVAGIPPGYETAVRVIRIGVGLAIAAAAIALVVLRRRRSASTSDVLALVRSRSSAIATAAAISAMVQASFVLANVWLARQVGVTTAIAPWFVALPLAKLAAVLPISLGGIGVREGALVSLLAPYGAPRDGVLASGILWQAVVTVSALVGLLTIHLLPDAPTSVPTPAAKA